MKFNGASGKKPSAEARRYVYLRLAKMFQSPGGCLAYHLGLDSDDLDEFDRRRLRKAMELVESELLRKANS